MRRFWTISMLVGACLIALSMTPISLAASPAANGKIAFDTNRDGNPEVYVMNADGSEQTNLTNNPARDWSPAWSPDGTKIAFQTDRDGNYEVYLMTAGGTGLADLTNNAAVDFLPAWSPDGTKIAFVSNRDGNEEVYVMNADGTGQTDLTNNAALDYAPAWSPDGTKIAFQTDRDGNYEVYVMNANGTGQTDLTSNAAADRSPAWSPDGTKIAFATERAGAEEIYVMAPDGSDPTDPTNNPYDDQSRRPASLCLRPIGQLGWRNGRFRGVLMLEIHDLTKRYGDVVALDGATFSVAPGTDRGVPRAERRGQDHHDAGHLRAGAPGSGRGPMEGRARRPGRARPVRIHAGRARVVSEDEGGRTARLLRRTLRAVQALEPRRPRAGG